MANGCGRWTSHPTIAINHSALSHGKAGVSVSRPRRPHSALVLLRHRAETFVHKLLQPLTAVGFGRVYIALRIGGDAMHCVELSGLPAAVAEARELGQRLAIEHVDLLVRAVREVEVLLLRIPR